MMRLLLDTHIVLWWFYDTGRLTKRATTLIQDADEVFVSAVSFWEIAIKVQLGKLRADLDEIAALIRANDFQELAVHFRHGQALAALPKRHGDPFDRLLVAQAMLEPLHLVTADTQLKPYSSLVMCV